VAPMFFATNNQARAFQSLDSFDLNQYKILQFLRDFQILFRFFNAIQGVNILILIDQTMPVNLYMYMRLFSQINYREVPDWEMDLANNSESTAWQSPVPVNIN
jgi:hypothetical protein